MKVLAQIKKHLPVAILAGVILLILLAILVRHLVWLASAWRPFENIELSEAVQYYPPSYQYTFTKEELALIQDELRQVVAYGESKLDPLHHSIDGGTSPGGYRLTDVNGEVIEIGISIENFGCWIVINGISYEGKPETLEVLRNLLNTTFLQHIKPTIPYRVPGI